MPTIYRRGRLLGGRRPLDQPCYGIGVRHHHHVRGAFEDHSLPREPSLSHERHRWRRNVLVRIAIDEPGWNVLPSRVSRFLVECCLRYRALCCRHQRCLSLRDIGRELRMEFVLEDVEILAAVREIGIDYAQGFAVSEPQPFQSGAAPVLPREDRSRQVA